ncbi:hypothetical protein Ciccas_014446, partial [Cichlidogyrus casuarinus]
FLVILSLLIVLPLSSGESHDSKIWLDIGHGQEMDLATESWNVTSYKLPDNFKADHIFNVSGKLYLLGGNKELTEHQVYSLRPIGRSWWYQEIHRKPYRLQTSAVLVGTRIYLIGGIADSSTCEYLETSKYWLSWQKCAPMFGKRYCTAAVAYEGRIYAFGGSEEFRPTRLVQRYNPDTDRWTRLPPMPIATSCGAAAVLNNLIYVIGGFNEMSYLETFVQVFDPTISEWRDDLPVKSMNLEHYGAPLMAFNGSLYIAGSSSSTDTHKKVEKYDPKTNTWRVLPNEMIKSPSGLFTTVLK